MLTTGCGTEWVLSIACLVHICSPIYWLVNSGNKGFFEGQAFNFWFYQNNIGTNNQINDYMHSSPHSH